mgnify:CR=1 FL=1
MLTLDTPALLLAPMDGVTDASMRALQGEQGAFTLAVSEFLRVSAEPLSRKVFRRDIPELNTDCRTTTGLPVQIQLLGGNPERMALSAQTAHALGANSIDLNFGCPAATVNRHDGGASLLQYPQRIREIVAAVRGALPQHVAVSAKLRLGWDDINSIHENAAMAAEGGASWITIHARTKKQGYAPPVYWKPIGQVREALNIPVVANGDIWTLDDFKRCRQETGCLHYMLGRGALANPSLSHQVAGQLGLPHRTMDWDWLTLFRGLVKHAQASGRTLLRLKQWGKMASTFGDFPYFQAVKLSTSVDEFLENMV